MRVTIKAINKALADAGIKAEIFKGYGYYYFNGDDMDYSKQQGVYGVNRLSDLSVDRWVQEAKDLIK